MARAVGAAPSFDASTPIRHAILDGLFVNATLLGAAREYPPPSSSFWKTYLAEDEYGKQEGADWRELGDYSAALLAALTGEQFVAFLSALTGVEPLVPALEGAGLHQSGPGAYLNLHRDFNRHPTLDLNRRLNVILYLNPGWEIQDGGSLVLADERGLNQRRVVPVLNRLVVFDALDPGFHGHPEPVVGRAGGHAAYRRSIAVFYYTNAAPSRPPAHSTQWYRRE
jgi:hypothetical protein